MMNREGKINAIREILHHMREKPGMYFSTPSAAHSYLRGFLTASEICLDLPSDTGIRATVMTERGWAISWVNPWKEMKEKGLDDAAIIDEMLTIEIEVWKRLYSDLDQQSPLSEDQSSKD